MMNKAYNGKECPACGGTETFEICSPVETGNYTVDDMGWLLECHTCDDIHSTMPF